MNKVYQKLEKCYKCIREKTDFVPEIALVLGSGLGDFAESVNVKIELTVPYSEIKGFPTSTVLGHKGQFVFGTVNGVKTAIMQGRVHFYEGYDISDVVLPVRLMGMMGAKVLFLTNASGGINESFQCGDFMLITDHISSLVKSPLVGENIDELGVRFPDMSEIYDRDLRDIIKKSADELDIKLKEGVYIQTTGPQYESPAEIRAFKAIGADAVGMSTACEAIAANHMGLKICGISCISNLAAGISKNPLTHKEVQETADRVAPDFKRLLTESIENISDYLNMK